MALYAQGTILFPLYVMPCPEQVSTHPHMPDIALKLEPQQLPQVLASQLTQSRDRAAGLYAL